MRGSEVDFIEDGSALIAEEGVVEFCSAVFAAEEEAEGVFGVVGGSGESAADAESGVDLEFAGAVGIFEGWGIDPFQGGRAFCGDAAVVGVGVDAA